MTALPSCTLATPRFVSHLRAAFFPVMLALSDSGLYRENLNS
jgi:hypothetical protein